MDLCGVRLPMDGILPASQPAQGLGVNIQGMKDGKKIRRATLVMAMMMSYL